MSDSIQTIPVRTAPDYTVSIGPGLLTSCGQRLREVLGPCRAAVIADSTVAPLYAPAVTASLSAAGFSVCSYQFPAGEAHKNLSTLSEILEFLAREHLTRSDCVVALGGGVAGDMAGFAAAVYLRGIRCVQLPTTLLAAVDSSVGGKTAIDLDGVKNAVGAFHQPRAVLIDTDVLQTLSPRQTAEGLAESVKMAMTCDASLLSLIETASDLTAALPEIIARSLRIKAQVVEQDPTEQGLRRVLNFGHTLGHAIESCAGGELLHGECVALGMVPMCAPPLRPRLTAMLQRCGLPTECGCTAGQLLPYLLHDKKAASGSVTAVLVDEPGTFRMETMTPEEILRRWEERNT